MNKHRWTLTAATTCFGAGCAGVWSGLANDMPAIWIAGAALIIIGLVWGGLLIFSKDPKPAERATSVDAKDDPRSQSQNALFKVGQADTIVLSRNKSRGSILEVKKAGHIEGDDNEQR